jgi:hypothetical protein
MPSMLDGGLSGSDTSMCDLILRDSMEGSYACACPASTGSVASGRGRAVNGRDELELRIFDGVRKMKERRYRSQYGP